MPLPAPNQLLRIALGAAVCVAAYGFSEPSADRRPAAHAGMLRVLHFGDSHTGSSTEQAALKKGLQERFGDGGQGYSLPWLNRHGNSKIGASAGWRRITLTGKGTDALVGLNGSAFEADRKRERAWFEGSFGHLRLYLLRQPGGGAVRISVDGHSLGNQPLGSPSPTVAMVEKTFEAGSAIHRIEIETIEEGKSRILGLALEGSAGAVYSGLGMNGAQAAWLLRLPEPVLETQMREESPDLIILAFGTNEANGRDFNPAVYERTLKQVVERVRHAAPLASLLLVAPPDADLRSGPIGSLEQVSSIQRALAEAQGAGFVDLRASMGGEGSIRQWLAVGLAQRDLVHFTPQGYDRHARVVLAGVLHGLEGIPGLSPEVAINGRPGAPLSLPQTGPPPSNANTIYVFRTRDGRTIISDNPSLMRGLQGEWVGQKPGTEP